MKRESLLLATLFLFSCSQEKPQSITGCGSGEYLDDEKNQCVDIKKAASQGSDIELVDIVPDEGSAVGGDTISIYGVNLVEGMSVTIGGAPCNNVTLVSDLELTCETTAHSSGLVDVIVSYGDYSFSLEDKQFYYLGNPLITSVSPTVGSVSGGDTLTINGYGFVSGATVVLDPDGTAVNCTPVTFVSSNQLTCTTGAHALSTVDVKVINPDTQTDVEVSSFSYQPAPTITNISPSEGAIAGGSTITITGTNFFTGVVAKIDGTNCTTTTRVSSTTLTCVTPAHALGAVDVEVVNTDTQTATSTNGFTYIANLSITSYRNSTDTANQAYAASGSSSTILIKGTGFINGAVVKFGGSSGTACSSLTFNSSTELACVTPTGLAQANYSVYILNPGNKSVTDNAAFAFNNPPVLTSFSRTKGAIAGGETITITGSNFLANPDVKFDPSGSNISCDNIVRNSSTQITCDVPNYGAAATVDVAVVNYDGQSDDLANYYSFRNAPTITSVDDGNGAPIEGFAVGGTVLTIAGTNFDTSSIDVKVGTVTCTVTALSATSITCTVGAGTGTNKTIKVTNIDDQFVNAADTFDFIPAPVITNISPAYGPIAGGTTVTITGTNFDVTANTQVTIGGTACAAGGFSATSTSITCVTQAKTAGIYNLVVTNDDTQTDTELNAYTYLNPPAISGVSPTMGASSGGTLITITGSYFKAGATVTLNGNNCTGVTVVSSSQITCTTPNNGGPGNSSVVVTNPDSQSATVGLGYVFRDPPTVTLVTPNEGIYSGGTAVTLTGTNFFVGASVSFSGVACTGITVVNSTTITCTTGAYAPGGLVNVSVTNTDSQTGTGNNLYRYRLAPNLSTVAPSIIGNTSTTNLTLTGTNFDDINGATVVIDPSGAAASCTALTVVSPTSITCTAPAGLAAGTYSVQVINNDTQSHTKTTAITVKDPPTFATVTNDKGRLSGGTTLTITGTGFYGAATVTVGGSSCTSVNVSSSTSLTCSTPSGTAGQKNIVITNPDGQNVTAVNAYEYVVAPSVASVSVTSGPLSGGGSITITGSDFFNVINSGVSTPTITVAGVSCSPVTFNSSTSLTCTLGNSGLSAPSTLTGNVIVNNPDGQQGSLTNAYTYRPAPVINTLSPVGGNIAGGDTITINGFYFNGVTTIEFDGVACTSVNNISSTQVQCVGNPAHADGNVAVRLVNADAQEVTYNFFDYSPAPDLISVSPTGGNIAGGTLITLTGTNFDITSASQVKINGVNCTSTGFSQNATTITCTTPAQGAGTYNIVVTNDDGQTDTLAAAYTYAPAPTVTSLSQNYGKADGTTANVIVNGTNFVAGATVEFDGAAAACAFVSSVAMNCTPAAHAATAPTKIAVVVENPDGQTGTLNNAYQYQDAPTFVSVSPSVRGVSGGDFLTITGTNFFTGATVTVGGVNCSLTLVVNSTTITCISPAGLAGAQDIVITNLDTQAVTAVGAFTYRNAPTITGLNVNQGFAAGGTNLIITGTNFDDSVSPTSVTVLVGTFTCTVTAITTTQIDCTTGAGSGSNLGVKVTNAIDNQNVTSGVGNQFTYKNAPSITSINRSAGSLAGTETITISGNNFDITGNADVTIGGTACDAAGFTFSSTSISCNMPAKAAGTYSLVVTNQDTQSATMSNAYTYQAAPDVVSVSPQYGALAGGNTLTISGTGFLTGATVLIGIQTCSGVNVSNPTTITCTLPSSIASTVGVTVTNTDDQSDTEAGIYTYRAAPTVTNISPNQALTNGLLLDLSTLVTITGANFDTIGGSTVTIGGNACTGVTVVNSTTITCNIPSGTAGAKNVVVTNTADSQAGTLSSGFTYVNQAILAFDEGAGSPTPPNPADYGTTNTNVTYTFTVENIGTATSSSLTVSVGGTHAAVWLKGTDNCTGNTLSAGGTCTVQVTFLGGFFSSGAYNATLNVNATTGGSDSNALQGTVP